MSVCHFLAELVIYTTGNELGERTDERNLSGNGKSCRYADHVGFCDTALDESFRECLCESSHLERAFEVCRKGKHSIVFASCDGKTLTETAAGIDFACVNIFLHTKNLLKFQVTAS